MTWSTLNFHLADKVAIVTLHRPEVGNAIDILMRHELAEACQKVLDEDAWVMILTGGEEVFSVGEDWPAADIEGWQQQRRVAGLGFGAVANLNVPVIAAVAGQTLGAGLELALACDIRIAARNAHFGFPEVAHGLIPGNGGTQRLPRLVGIGRALEMLLTAETIDAHQALDMDLVTKVVPSGQCLATAQELAQKLISRGPIALRYAKEAALKGMDMTLDQGLRLEADLTFLLQTTQDREEGIRAFREKRQPHFQGR